jgi:hypothetical protein
LAEDTVAALAKTFHAITTITNAQDTFSIAFIASKDATCITIVDQTKDAIILARTKDAGKPCTFRMAVDTPTVAFIASKHAGAIAIEALTKYANTPCIILAIDPICLTVIGLPKDAIVATGAKDAGKAAFTKAEDSPTFAVGPTKDATLVIGARCTDDAIFTFCHT